MTTYSSPKGAIFTHSDNVKKALHHLATTSVLDSVLAFRAGHVDIPCIAHKLCTMLNLN